MYSCPAHALRAAVHYRKNGRWQHVCRAPRHSWQHDMAAWQREMAAQHRLSMTPELVHPEAPPPSRMAPIYKQLLAVDRRRTWCRMLFQHGTMCWCAWHLGQYEKWAATIAMYAGVLLSGPYFEPTVSLLSIDAADDPPKAQGVLHNMYCHTIHVRPVAANS